MTAKPTTRRRRQARRPKPRTARASFSPSRNSRAAATAATANSANRSWSISTAGKTPSSEPARFSFQHYMSHSMKAHTQQRSPIIRAISLVAVGFGLLTIKEGGMTLIRSEEHTSELQSQSNLVCPLLLFKQNTELLLQPSLRLSLRHTPSTSQHF